MRKGTLNSMRKFSTVLTTVVAATAVATTAMLPTLAGASSHREAPLISMDPAADLTDVYAFVSPDRPEAVTLIMNVYPDQSAYGGPNFYRFGDDVLYQFNIDNDGDAVADINYQFRFETRVRNGNTFLYNTGVVESTSDPDLNVYQVYDMARNSISDDGSVDTENLAGDLPVAPPNIGTRSTPNTDQIAGFAVQPLSDGSVSFAGQRDDPFFVDLSAIFDLLQMRCVSSVDVCGSDGLARKNVSTIALQIPSVRLDGGDGIIGVWATTHRKATRVLPNQPAGGIEEEGFNQVSRLGHPLVNEVVVPLAFKDFFNASEPVNDLANYGDPAGPVLDPEVPKLLNAVFGLPVPAAPRMDIVTIFLTGIEGLNQPTTLSQPAEMLRLNMNIPASAVENSGGVLAGDLAGFPNGRRLGDDVTDTALQVMAGQTPFTPEFNTDDPAMRLGDGVPVNDQPFMSTFPYVSTPHSGYLVGNESQTYTGTP
jgi:hypothetical protein